MKLFHSLQEIPPLEGIISFTVGTFDGVHLGHQRLLEEMKLLGTSVVFTFTNHPSEILSPNHQTKSILSLTEKLEKLRSLHVDVCVVQPFTADLAKKTYDLFLGEIHSILPFNHIFFGAYDTLGKGREGTPEKIHALGKHLGFTAHYLEKLEIDHEMVSSSRIRRLLENNNQILAKKLLGDLSNV